MGKLPIVGIVLGLLSAVAFAQPDPTQPQPPPPDPNAGAPAVTPVPMQPPAVQAPATTVEKGVVEDANAGRSWIAPTALTEPKGTFTFSDFELLMVSGTYAVTDDISVGATTILPIVKEMPKVGALNIKAKVLHQGQFHLAAQAALMGGFVSVDHTTYDSMGNPTGTETESAGSGFLVLGGAATYCIDVDCYSHVSGYLGAGFVRQEQNAVPFLVSGNAAIRVGKHVKLIAEIDSAFIAGDINESIDGFFFWYGVRFTSAQIGVDLGFLKPVYLGDGGGDDPLLLGVPFVSFSYRAM